MNILRDDDDRDPRDDEWSASLRAAYAAPADESYWAALERRIMARIQREAAREWWSYFPGWVRIGLAAAAITLLAAGVAAWRTRLSQERVAYRELLEAPTELPILTEKFRDHPDARTREATLRYLIAR
jgi:anti-sigma-K factor RskA